MRISLILPAKNEEQGLRRTLPGLRELMPDTEVIVVDDGSTDDTAAVSAAWATTVLSSPYSMGNGAAIKRGARAATGDVLVFMDADGQHDLKLVPRLLEKLDEGFDMAVGARDAGGQANLHRGLANAFYNRVASWMTGHRVLDLTSGFRAVRADKFREFLHLLPNGFSYPTTITMAFFRAGYAVGYEQIVAAQREGKSHIRPLRDGLRFLLIIIKVGTLFSPMKLFVPLATTLFVTGCGWYAWTYAQSGRFTQMSALLISVSVLTFLIGMVSDQVTTLMYMHAASRQEARQDSRRDD